MWRPIGLSGLENAKDFFTLLTFLLKHVWDPMEEDKGCSHR